MTPRAAAIAIVAAMLASATTAHASEPHYSRSFDACVARAAGVTVAMLDCIGAEHEVQDRRLNAAYRAALVRLSPARQASLRKAQRAWLAFRDADCDLEFDPEGGTAANLMGVDCMLRLTAERAERLDTIGAAP